MKLLLAVLLNASLLAGLLRWLAAERRHAPLALRRWLLPALGGRLLLTAISSQLLTKDARTMSDMARTLTAAFWQQPGKVWQLAATTRVPGAGQDFDNYSLSNTLFFSKLLAVLNLASLGSNTLNALYLSLLCFGGCWLLARAWVACLPATPALAPVLALLLWPTTVWWTAGIGKETVLLGSEAALVALVLPLLVPPAPGQRPLGGWKLLGRVAAALALAWLAYRMRYFYALPLVAALAAIGAAQALLAPQRRRWPLLLGLGALAAGGSLAFSQIMAQVDPGNFFPFHLYESYSHGLERTAGRLHLEFPGLAPTRASMLAHAPAAAWAVLSRPWLGESANLGLLGAGLENLLLLLLLALAGLALLRGRAGRLPGPLALVLLAYCLLLAAFIGLSTPSFGTISRYRAALLPWLLLVLLQNDYARRGLARLAGQGASQPVAEPAK